MIDSLIDALQKSWPMALGIALSPGPVLAVIVLLMTPQAKSSAPSFLIGWLLAIMGVGTFIILLPGVVASHGGLSPTTGIIKILLGIVLLIIIFPIWKNRPKSGGLIKIPKIFQGIDNFGITKSFIAGFLSTALSIKNLALSASGAAHIDATALIDYFETLIGLFLFSIIASFTLIVPIIIYFIAPVKMKRIGLELKNWLIQNYTIITIIMLLIFGIVLIYIGLKIYLT